MYNVKGLIIDGILMADNLFLIIYFEYFFFCVISDIYNQIIIEGDDDMSSIIQTVVETS